MKKFINAGVFIALAILIFGFSGSKNKVFSQTVPVTVCDSGSNLSYDQAVVSLAHGELSITPSVDLSGNQVTVTINNNTPCYLPVSLASYKMFGPYSLETLSEQEFFDGTSLYNVAPNSTEVLSVNLPQCAVQYDVWYGAAPTVLVNNQPYGIFLFGNQLRQNSFCVVPPIPPIITVIKQVINDDGRTRTVADFPLFVSGTSVTSGVAHTLPFAGIYTVTETNDSDYTQTFSGDCDASGNVTLAAGESKTCTITNNDIPPTVVPAAPTPPADTSFLSGGAIYPPVTLPVIIPILAPAVTPATAGIVLGVSDVNDIPDLPRTGFGPLGKIIPLNIYMAVIVMALAFALFIADLLRARKIRNRYV